MNRIVTTSWDDNSILNKKLLRILNRFKAKGTFYISGVDDHGNSLEEKKTQCMVLDIKNSGHEIGVHGKNHIDLTKCQNLRLEIRDFKKELEEMLNQEIRSFSYPYGKFDDFVKNYVKESGFEYARTVQNFEINYPKDSYSAGTSIYVSRTISLWERVRFVLKFFPLGTTKFMTWMGMSRLLFDIVYQQGGVFHLWGHAHDLEEQMQWDKLVILLRYINRRKGIKYVTNGEILEHVEDY